MRSFDFAPYYRSTVGFDRLFSMLDQVGGVEGSGTGRFDADKRFRHQKT